MRAIQPPETLEVSEYFLSADASLLHVEVMVGGGFLPSFSSRKPGGIPELASHGCGLSSTTFKEEFLRHFTVQKGAFHYGTGTGPVGRKSCTAIVTSDWFYTFLLVGIRDKGSLKGISVC